MYRSTVLLVQSKANFVFLSLFFSLFLLFKYLCTSRILTLFAAHARVSQLGDEFKALRGGKSVTVRVPAPQYKRA